VVRELRAQGTWCWPSPTCRCTDGIRSRCFRSILVVAGSRHVIASLHAAGIDRIYPTAPVRDRATRTGRRGLGPGQGGLRYDWDRHKVRDRLLGALEPLWEPFLPRPEFVRRPGLTWAWSRD